MPESLSPNLPLTPVRVAPQNRVLSDVILGPAGATAALIVDQGHPFFYDHPLDHVPGLLLIEAAMQLAGQWRAAHPGPEPLRQLSVRFLKYCLHDIPVTLALSLRTEGAAHHLEVLFTQSGQPRARITLQLMAGSVDLRPDPRLSAYLAAHSGQPLVPVAAARVGKLDPANLMITAAAPLSGPSDAGSLGAVAARLLPAAPGNALADPEGAAQWHPLYLLEGWMQVLRFLNTDPDRRPERFRDILAGIELWLEAPAPRDADLGLLAETDPRPLPDPEGRWCARAGVIGSAETTFARVHLLTARPGARPAGTAGAAASEPKAESLSETPKETTHV